MARRKPPPEPEPIVPEVQEPEVYEPEPEVTPNPDAE